ncbi:hypothetical protein RFI_12499, partial [Reticulomyxa filosa]
MSQELDSENKEEKVVVEHASPSENNKNAETTSKQEDNQNQPDKKDETQNNTQEQSSQKQEQGQGQRQEQEKEKEKDKTETETTEPKDKEQDKEKEDEEKEKSTSAEDTDKKDEKDERIGHVFTFGKGMVYKVDSIEQGKVTCIRIAGDFDFPKGIYLTEEVLRTLKPKSSSEDTKEVEYTKGFEFELNEIEYRVDGINENRVTCVRVAEHEGSPKEFEIPLLQLGKLNTKPG